MHISDCFVCLFIVKCQSKKENSYDRGGNCLYLKKNHGAQQTNNSYKNANSYFAM